MTFCLLYPLYLELLLYALTTSIVRVDPYCSTLSSVLKLYYSITNIHLSTLRSALLLAPPCIPSSSNMFVWAYVLLRPITSICFPFPVRVKVNDVLTDLVTFLQVDLHRL